MNRRAFLSGALKLAAAAGLAKLPICKKPAPIEQETKFLLDSCTAGVGRLSPMMLDNLGMTFSLTNTETGERIPLDGPGRPISWDETDAARAERFAQQMRDVCDAIKPSIDAIAEPRECVIPKSGRVWYVGPSGDDASDGLSPESCVQTMEAGLILAGRGDEASTFADAHV